MKPLNADLKLYKSIHYTLRIAAALCFIGHGTFGIITKPIWCNYFAVFGIGHDLAYQLMPLVGCFDVLCGLMILVYPLRIVPAWLVIWGFITALCRPLSGEPFGEFIERAGNYGAPLALLILSGTFSARDLFKPLRSNPQPDKETRARLALCLRVLAFLLLLGHGGLNLVMKKGLIDQYTSMGFANPQQVAQMIGLVEITAAFVILIKPLRWLVFTFFLWKMSCELFYPRYELFEWIERSGSYGVLLALWLVTERQTFFEWKRGLRIRTSLGSQVKT